MSNDPRIQTQLDEIVDEFLTRRQAGEQPEIEEFRQRAPEIAELVEKTLKTILMVDDLKNDTWNTLPGAIQATHTKPAAPPVIADYHIIQKIGQGGMGIVYEAVQESLDRRVALKTLPAPVAHNERFVERFKREARAAAGLHHTNIVPVFDVGQDGDTLYYAMQFIDGQPLHEIIHQKQTETGNEKSATTHPLPGSESTGSSPDQKQQAWFHAVARLGAAVANALDYAHDRSIIHRDVKPSNLILDKHGVVWLADFGLAKTTDSELTETGDFVGTARYMSPERFRGKADHRGDIYGLGVTLYELLTLQRAFDAENRILLIDQIASHEARRPRDINRNVPLDLETIVLKAMDKDPRRRYQNAMDMADDLWRFIDDQPIRARRASTVERTVRWMRRNKALTTAMISMVAAIAILITSTILFMQQRNIAKANYTEAEWQRRQADENLKEALRQEKRADREARDSRDAVKKLLSTVGDQRLRNVPFMDDLRRQLLEEALAFNQQFLDRSDSQDDRYEVALAHQRVAEIYRMLGRIDEAGQSLNTSREIILAVLETRTGDPDLLEAVADVNASISDNLKQAGKFTEAGKIARQAASEYTALLADNPDDIDLILGQIAAWQQLAQIDLILRNMNPAESVVKQIISLIQQLPDELRQLPICRMNQADSLMLLGDILYTTGRPDAGIEAFEQSQQLFSKLSDEFPNERNYQEGLAENANFLGAYYLKTGRLEEAANTFRIGVDSFGNLANQYPQIPDYRSTMANQLSGLATSLAISGDQEGALEMFRSSASQFEKLISDFPAVPYFQSLAANGIRRLGVHYMNIGQADKAVEPFTRAFEIMEKLVENNPSVMPYRIDFAELAFLTSTLPVIREADDSRGLEYAQKAVTLAQQVVQNNPQQTRDRHKLAKYHANVAEYQAKRGANDLAETQFNKAIEQQRILVAEVPDYEEYRRWLAVSLFKLCELYVSDNRLDEAFPLIRECIDIRRRNQQANQQRYDHPMELGLAFFQLGDMEQGRGNLEDAVIAYRSGVQVFQSHKDSFPQHTNFRTNAMVGFEKMIELHLNHDEEQEAASVVDEARELADTEASTNEPEPAVLDAWKRIQEKSGGNHDRSK